MWDLQVGLVLLQPWHGRMLFKFLITVMVVVEVGAAVVTTVVLITLDSLNWTAII